MDSEVNTVHLETKKSLKRSYKKILPYIFCILLKSILLLTFKCLYGQAPNYLIDFITTKSNPSTL